MKLTLTKTMALKGSLERTSFPCTLKVQHADILCTSKTLTAEQSSHKQSQHPGVGDNNVQLNLVAFLAAQTWSAEQYEQHGLIDL